MNIYPEHSSVPFSIAFTDASGQVVQPQHLNVVLKDGDEVLLAEIFDGSPEAAATAYEGTIPAEQNVIELEGELSPRMICVRMTLADGRVIQKDVIYGIEPLEMLVVCKNSFQSLPRALIEASQMVNLVAFNAEESRPRQVAALIEAYDRITNLRLIYAMKFDNRVDWHRLTNDSWSEMTQDTFDTQLPSRLKRALRHAQLMEADEILQGNILARKHASGIQSETIGESSVTLRAGFAGQGGVSSFTQSVLSPFLDTTISIGRA